jgi:prolyl oligopeptidase
MEPARTLAELAREFWEFSLDESPIETTYLGDGRGDDRLDERGPEARQRRDRRWADLQRRLAQIPAFEAKSEDELTRRVLELELAQQRESLRHHDWEWEVDHVFGLPLLLQNLMSVQPIGDEAARDRLLRRLREVPRAFAGLEADLRAGLASGRVPPRLAVRRAIGQLKTFAAAATDDTAFVSVVVGRIPKDVDGAGIRKRLAAAVEAHVRPAYLQHLRFLEDEVLPASRDAVGVCAIPGGREAYAARVRRFTTTDLSPEDIHRIGVEEMERNEAEMLEIARGEGHRGDLRSFLDAMREDERFQLDSREEILDRYRAICRRMDEALPRVFGRLPRVGYEIRMVEEFREKDCPAAFYQPPAEDGSRRGVFYANTHDPKSWPTYDFEPLCFHEAVPGHHLQIAIAQELDGLPKLRRHGGFTAYVEGWAHYTERLADEMGMYSTAYDRMGMLSAQAWRAARLVVDTGMHHFGWTRDQAIATMERVRSGSRSDVENEVDRYVIWPGQALAYKIGSRTITAIREDARARLGSRFDLRRFHDEVLVHGALPLSLLEDVFATWA